MQVIDPVIDREDSHASDPILVESALLCLKPKLRRRTLTPNTNTL